MNCEHVEGLLSAYLDNMLAAEERHRVVTHLQGCQKCSVILTDFMLFDTLVASLPRLSPRPDLATRIFFSPAYRELLAASDTSVAHRRHSQPLGAHRRASSRPHLVALPGGRARAQNEQAISTKAPTSPAPIARPDKLTRPHPARWRRRKRPFGLRVLQGITAALILLTLLMGSLIARNLWLQAHEPGSAISTITPPADLPQSGPLPAGTRVVFLRDGTLWSSSSDGSEPASRLTPAMETVAAAWSVRPPLAGRLFGNRIAYIDLQQGYVHTLRSDGQLNVQLPQRLLRSDQAPASLWDTRSGRAILNSLHWSPDGSRLAFVADPLGSGEMSLYLVSLDTNAIEKVPLPLKGSLSQLNWSPDSARLAFVLTEHDLAHILDYNIQNHGLLDITGNSTAPGTAILTVGWSPDQDEPALTWSTGASGHVMGIWLRSVDQAANSTPSLLMKGDFTQAAYNPNGHNNGGSWLLIENTIRQTANLWRLDMQPESQPQRLTDNERVGQAQWSPDGTHISYLEALTAGVGRLHLLDQVADHEANALLASGVTSQPAPSWSTDSLRLIYSTGRQIVVVDTRTRSRKVLSAPRGSANAFVWSTATPDLLIVTLSDGQPGIYLLDTRTSAWRQLDRQNASGPLFWTEVP